MLLHSSGMGRIRSLIKRSIRVCCYHSNDDVIMMILLGLLMSILFEVTAVDFFLNQHHSSFLDETWIIPVRPVTALRLLTSFILSKPNIICLPVLMDESLIIYFVAHFVCLICSLSRGLSCHR